MVSIKKKSKKKNRKTDVLSSPTFSCLPCFLEFGHVLCTCKGETLTETTWPGCFVLYWGTTVPLPHWPALTLLWAWARLRLHWAVSMSSQCNFSVLKKRGLSTMKYGTENINVALLTLCYSTSVLDQCEPFAAIAVKCCQGPESVPCVVIPPVKRNGL